MSTAEEAVPTVSIEQLRAQRYQALRRAKYVFREYPLICAIIEGEYQAARNAAMEHLPPDIVLHDVKTYTISDPVYEAFTRLQIVEHKYRQELRKYRAVNDVLKLLDDETKKLVELCYFKNKSIVWIVTHGDESGVYGAESTLWYRLQRAKELLARRMGFWPE